MRAPPLSLTGHTGYMGWWPFGRGKTPPLHVDTFGDSGSQIVLLHGIASSSVSFEHLIPLVSTTHRVSAVDLLGFGQSVAPPTATFTLDEHVDALALTVDRIRLRGAFTLVGHSLGALIAIRFAARYPQRVSHLVLIAPPVYLPKEHMADPVARIRMDLYYRLWDYLRHNPEFTSKASKTLDRMMPVRNSLEVTKDNWRAFSLSLENCIEDQTTLTDLAQVKAPIDLVYGTADPFVRPSAIEFIERLRGVATTRVDGADHVLRPKMMNIVAGLIDNPSPPTEPVRLVKPGR
jgi:pimeloyl-ACP methyl ester carboxylesterase